MGEPSTDPRPYQRVYADLRARIEGGELAPGAQLPSQPTLAAEYRVALLTVRHAIELLRRGGFLLAELLRLQGISVREAPDGSTALEAVDEEAFTHVFLDFRMPGLGGAEVARLIRLQDDRAVIVFLSAYPEDVVRARIRGVGPAPVRGKPFDPADVLAALRLSLAPEEPLEPFGG